MDKNSPYYLKWVQAKARKDAFALERVGLKKAAQERFQFADTITPRSKNDGS
jgi:hypothetical protein